MAMEEKHIQWKAFVLAAYEESIHATREITENRDDFCKGLVAVAREEDGHKTIAKLFRGMFPDRFVYLGKRDGWFFSRRHDGGTSPATPRTLFLSSTTSSRRASKKPWRYSHLKSPPMAAS
jgi:hypothetical protein